MSSISLTRDWMKAMAVLSTAISYFSLMASSLPGDERAGPKVLDIGSRRELFVDRLLIDRLEGTALKLHEPSSGGVANKDLPP